MSFKRVGPRLYLSFGILTIVLLMGSSWLIYGLNNIKSSTDTMINSDFAQYQAIEKITLGVVQVQQWLTFISATRGLDGLDDGFDQAERYADIIRTNIEKIKELDPKNIDQYQQLLDRFDIYYITGEGLAHTYINQGPSGGNLFMAQFDAASRELQNSIKPVLKRIHGNMRGNLAFGKQSIDTMSFLTLVVSGLIFVLLMFSGYMINTTLKRLNTIRDAMCKISEGTADLSANIAVETEDEIAMIASAFNQFVGKIKHMIDQVINVSEQLSVSSQHAQAITVTTSDSLTTQAAAVQNLAEAIGNMSMLTFNVKSSIENTTQQVQTVAEQSQSGREVIESSNLQIQKLAEEVNAVNNTVSELNQHNTAIGTVVTMIASIAEQTNLLALNAAIEAARAGEHGRGFAVVADEVRHLSASTTQATQDIQQLINAIQTSSSNALEQVENSTKVATLTLEKSSAAGEAFDAITKSVEEIRTHASDVVNLSVEQSTLSENVYSSIARINEEVQTLSDTAKQNISENGDLSQYSVLLNSIVSGMSKNKDVPITDNSEFF